jgi:hypothetical protein
MMPSPSSRAALRPTRSRSTAITRSTGLTVADIAADQGYAELARYFLSVGAELTPVADPKITDLPGKIRRITFCYRQCTNILMVDAPDEALVIDTGYVRTTEKLKTPSLAEHDTGVAKQHGFLLHSNDQVSSG